MSEPESDALRRFLGRRPDLVSSALARTEVARALLALGTPAIRRGRHVLEGVELVRISDRILGAAGAVMPAELRTLDAIHLATMLELRGSLARVVTYDERLAAAVSAHGHKVLAPA